MPEYIHTMLATLGGQPQVVTFTLDLLLQRNIPISEVIVIHPDASHPRLKHSLDCLNSEFIGDRYRTNNRKIHLRSHVLRLGNEPLEDIVDDVSANAALNTIHGLIRDLKQQSRPIIIHLSVPGGRRLMSFIYRLEQVSSLLKAPLPSGVPTSPTCPNTPTTTSAR